MREEELEHFLAINAYLIDSRFDGIRPTRQLADGRHRLDLLFSTRAGDVIVELKRGPLTADAVRQLEGYVAAWSHQRRLAKTHYLVGRAPTERAALDAAIRAAPFRIALRLLGEHIPLRYLYDMHDKKYVRYDERLARVPERYGPEKRWEP